MNSFQEQVVLVDANDQAIGVAEKHAAHRDGALHRAFSVFVFDSQQRLLLQRRASTKYHSAGLWSNTCCGHPRPGEALEQAANRRLWEEMGFSCALQKAFSFSYRVELGNGLIENEVDHVFVGSTDAVPEMNLQEVEDFHWMSLSHLGAELARRPEQFSYWLAHCLQKVTQYMSEHQQGAC